MTPEQATAYLDQKAAQYAAQQTARVPTAEEVGDAHIAELRLAKLSTDQAWLRRYAAGSIPERREYEALIQAIAAGIDETTDSVVVGEVETVVGDNAVRRQDMISTIEDLSRVGIPDEGIIRTLNADFSDDDIEWAQRELDRAMATPSWRDALLAGDPTAKHEFTALCAVVSAGKAA
jgi:hypothetical protein